MVEVKVYSGGSVKAKKVDASAFGDRILARTLKDAVVMYEANARAGTVKTKTRGEVAGPNNKLWKQKHTGRARMGTTKGNIWRGGGLVFGPRPRSYQYQMPVKARRSALRNAIYSKFQDNEVAIADGWPEGQPSTKQAHAILVALGMPRSALVVTESQDNNLHMSLRNVPQVNVRPVSDLNAHEVLLHRYLVLTPGAMELLKGKLGKVEKSGVSSKKASKAESPKEAAKKSEEEAS
ncbi:MAG: 50S ribosomal protein L4 [Planctomycetota bacterium]|jgi:large subunit ribosomal protein L4